MVLEIDGEKVEYDAPIVAFRQMKALEKIATILFEHIRGVKMNVVPPRDTGVEGPKPDPETVPATGQERSVGEPYNRDY